MDQLIVMKPNLTCVSHEGCLFFLFNLLFKLKQTPLFKIIPIYSPLSVVREEAQLPPHEPPALSQPGVQVHQGVDRLPRPRRHPQPRPHGKHGARRGRREHLHRLQGSVNMIKSINAYNRLLHI